MLRPMAFLATLVVQLVLIRGVVAESVEVLSEDDYQIYSVMIEAALHGNDTFVVVGGEVGGSVDKRSVDEVIAETRVQLLGDWCDVTGIDEKKNNEVLSLRPAVADELLRAYVTAQKNKAKLDRRLSLKIPYELLVGPQLQANSNEWKELDRRYPDWKWSAIGLGRIGYDSKRQFALSHVGYHLVGGWIMMFRKTAHGWQIIQSCMLYMV